MKQKIYICEHCGNVAAMLKDAGVPVFCCGQKMKELIPGTTDGAAEKHVPVYQVKDGLVTVTVGENKHPMLQEHYVEWIALQTKQGCQYKTLQPGEEPSACFALCQGDQVEKVYAYCNLHSLWERA